MAAVGGLAQGRRALVIGEALIDIVHAPTGTVKHPGGGPANVALGLARLENHVALLTRLGDDDHGRTVARHLRRSGVHVLPGSFGAGATSTATAVLDSHGGATYRFDIQWDLPPAPVAVEATVLHVGSVGAFLDPGADRVLEWVQTWPGVITLDPNIRPALVGPWSRAVSRFEALAARATFLKLSDEDAAWLYPDRDPAGVLEHLLGLGAFAVALTCGSAGSVLATQADIVRIPPRSVPVVDTIGAGDTYMAALIDRLLRDGWECIPADRLASMGDFAARAAAVTVTRAGADLPHRADLCDET